MNNVILSILICTIPERSQIRQRVIESIRSQLPTDGSVELLIHEDLPHKDGGPTIGNNRNELLDVSCGEYICFVDDDDTVSEDYVEKILEALKDRPDVVGIQGHYYSGDNPPRLFIHSILYDKWFESEGIYYRCPNHLNPVKRMFAVKVKFPDKSHGEDMEYSMALRPFLHKEAMIDKVIYNYYESPKNES